MKHLRKSILTLLALTLFGGAGAWAQTTVTWTASQINGININCHAGTASGNTIAGITVTGASGVPGSWYGTFIDFGPDGGPFTFTSTVGDITSIVISAGYIAVDGLSAGWTASASALSWSGTAAASVSLTAPTGMADEITQVVFTIASAEPAEIELTKAGANQWTLGQTPDYDLELQVEYYEAHALKEIPAGWTVKVNDIDKTAAIVGDSLMITETDSVTLVPAGNPRRVKSVTLEDEAPAVVEPITVTWNNDDITGSGHSFTKDGVTITADIDFNQKNFMDGGTFTTTLGNFTKIEVTAGSVSMLSGTGWSGNSTKKTWTGNASSVSFSGDIMGMGMGNTQFVFTIEPTN